MGLTLVSFNGMGAKGRHSPSLALLQLAPVVWGERVHCDIIDIQAIIQQRRLDWESPVFLDETAQLICSYGNRYIGFSTRCDTYPYVLEVARLCRTLDPDALVILGGPQATSVDVLTLQTFPFVDIVVRGEGEVTLSKLVRTLEKSEPLEQVEGITFRDRCGQIRKSPGAALIPNLGSLPLPAYEKYDDLYGDIDPEYGDVELGRGCPFTCNFCFTAEMWERKYRVRTVDSLLEHVRFLRDRYGIRKFRFIHDNVIFKKSPYVNELIERFAAENPPISWSASTRIDTLDLALLPELHAAGLSDLYFGIETGVDKIKHQLHKRFSLAQVLKVLDHLEKSQVAATLSFIVGFPAEEREDLEQTLSFALNCAVHKGTKCVQFHSLAPTTGTKLYTELKDRIRYDGSYSNHNGAIPMRESSIRELVRSHRDIFSNFYTIVRSQYPEDLPYAVQEILGCLTNFFPRTIKLVTHDLGISVLQFLDTVLNWMSSTGRKWEYGAEPDVDLKEVVSEMYASQDKEDVVVGALCRFEDTLYRHFLRVRSLRLANCSWVPFESLESDELVPALSPFVQILSSKWDPYALFQWALKNPSCSRNTLPEQIPQSYHLIYIAFTRNAYSVRGLKELEFCGLQLADGRRNLEQILRMLERQKNLFPSKLLRSYLRSFFKRLLLEGILERSTARSVTLTDSPINTALSEPGST